jgi:hypothetical protein
MNLHAHSLLRIVPSRAWLCFRRDWSTETDQWLPDWHKMEIFDTLWSSLCLSLSSSLSVSLTLVIVRSPTLPSIHSTILMHKVELIDATQTRNTHVPNDRQTVRWRNCLCSVLMSGRDGQRLGVSGSVSVRLKFLSCHIRSGVCRLSYQLSSPAGRHVEWSVTVLFSSGSPRKYYPIF